MPDGADESLDTAVVFIASQPGGPARLLEEHQPDARGLCAGCCRPGTGIPYLPWPCAIAKLAAEADKLQGGTGSREYGPAPTAAELDIARLTRSLGRHQRGQ
jgi:hypothetical protein